MNRTLLEPCWWRPGCSMGPSAGAAEHKAISIFIFQTCHDPRLLHLITWAPSGAWRAREAAIAESRAIRGIRPRLSGGSRATAGTGARGLIRAPCTLLGASWLVQAAPPPSPPTF